MQLMLYYYPLYFLQIYMSLKYIEKFEAFNLVLIIILADSFY